MKLYDLLSLLSQSFYNFNDAVVKKIQEKPPIVDHVATTDQLNGKSLSELRRTVEDALTQHAKNSNNPHLDDIHTLGGLSKAEIDNLPGVFNVKNLGIVGTMGDNGIQMSVDSGPAVTIVIGNDSKPNYTITMGRNISVLLEAKVFYWPEKTKIDLTHLYSKLSTFTDPSLCIRVGSNGSYEFFLNEGTKAPEGSILFISHAKVSGSQTNTMIREISKSTVIRMPAPGGIKTPVTANGITRLKWND